MKQEKNKKDFEVKGTFLEKKTKKTFTKSVSALNEKSAREKVFALFGSKQRIKRRDISIETVKEEM